MKSISLSKCIIIFCNVSKWIKLESCFEKRMYGRYSICWQWWQQTENYCQNIYYSNTSTKSVSNEMNLFMFATIYKVVLSISSSSNRRCILSVKLLMNIVNGFRLVCKCKARRIIKCQLHWNDCQHRRVCVAVPLNAMAAFKTHSDLEFNRQMDYNATKILLPK